jgi:hypothetical protein
MPSRSALQMWHSLVEARNDHSCRPRPALSNKGGAAVGHSAPGDRFAYEYALLLAGHVTVLMPSQGRPLKHAPAGVLLDLSSVARPGTHGNESPQTRAVPRAGASPVLTARRRCLRGNLGNMLAPRHGDRCYQPIKQAIDTGCGEHVTVHGLVNLNSLFRMTNRAALTDY